jgi:hypothetical protein
MHSLAHFLVIGASEKEILKKIGVPLFQPGFEGDARLWELCSKLIKRCCAVGSTSALVIVMTHQKIARVQFCTSSRAVGLWHLAKCHKTDGMCAGAKVRLRVPGYRFPRGSEL